MLLACFYFIWTLQFKTLDVVKWFVRRAKVIKIMAKYDNMILMPLFMVVFQFLVELPSFCNEDSIFGVMVSNEDIL